MDDFTLFSEADKQQMSYGACVGVTGMMGIGLGSVAPVLGTVAGGLSGLAVGLVLCKFVSPILKQKLLSSERFTDGEVIAALQAMRSLTGVQSKSDAMYLLGQVRQSIAAGDLNTVDQKACMPPQVAASMLLAQKSS